LFIDDLNTAAQSVAETELVAMSAILEPSSQLPGRNLTLGDNELSILKRRGAANRTRTCDPVITNDVLYQLSYCGGPNASLGPRPETPAPDIGHGPDWQEKRGL
jgi:hypothetical protein